jgi:endonuclease/exonuclease/phosphatase (EEP) superfamily protein YafD
LAAIQREAPDVLVIEEVNDRWLRDLRPLTGLFPHTVTVPRDDNFGIALFSRRPLAHQEVLDLGEVGVPTLRVRLALDGTRLTVLATHPVPPGSPRHYRWRNEQLQAVARMAAEQDGAVVVIGDLNTTPWSAHFRRMLRRGKLRDTGRGWGFVGTWPAWLWPLRIPLDHCLISGQLEVTHRRVGAAVGSDHLPLVVDLRPAASGSLTR